MASTYPKWNDNEIDLLREIANNSALLADGGGGSSLPSQGGNNGKFLTTDGTNPSWAAIAGGGDMLRANNLSDVLSVATARTNLGLGTAATTAATAYVPAYSGLTTNGVLQATGATTVASTLTPSGLTSVGTNAVTAAAATSLTLQAGSSGASLVLGQGANGGLTLTGAGTGVANLGKTFINGAATSTGAAGIHTGTDENFIFRSAVGMGPYTGGAIDMLNDAQNAVVNLLIRTQTLTLLPGTAATAVFDVSAFTKASTSTTTGALVVGGGIGVGGKGFFGDSVSVTTSLVTPSTTFALANTTATTVNAFGATTALNIGAAATCILNFGGSTTASEFRFLEPSGSGTNYTALKVGAQAANITYTLPAAVGASGSYLYDLAGNGTLSWNVPSTAMANNSALFTSTADAANDHVASDTSVIGTGVGSRTTPANYFAAGTVLIIDVTGYISTALTPDTLNVKIKAGSTTVGSTGAITTTGSLSNAVWRVLAIVTCRTAGASGTFIVNTIYESTGATIVAPNEAKVLNTATVTLDTTGTLVWDVTAIWGSTTAGDVITGTNALLFTPGNGAVLDPGANGIMARTSVNTTTARTITGTAAEITLTNGDGVSGNPTVSIPSSVTFTGKTITGGTYSVPTLSGVVTLSGTRVTTASAMSGTTPNISVDVTQRYNTKTIAVDSGFIFSGTPANTNQWFGAFITNSDSASHVLTIPSSFSVNRNAAITTLTIPASGKLYLVWNYDGSIYNLYGDPVATTGSGSYVLATSPTLVTPVLGVATATSINGLIISTTTGTFTLTNAKTLAVTNTLTLSGTDSTVMTFPTTSATIARTDAANTFTGASTASAWVLTSPTITTKLNPTTDDGAPLGDTTHNWSDLFLASGAVVNYANSNVVITHTSGIVTVGTGDWRVTTAGTNTASVVTVGGTQTLTAKTLTDAVNTVSTPVTTSVGYLGIPQLIKSADYTYVLADAGSHIYHPAADTNNRQFTIPSNASVAYPIGTTLTIVNYINTITVAINSDTMTLFAGAGTGSTGNRSLAAGGQCTALKVTSTTWVISGIGLT